MGERLGTIYGLYDPRTGELRYVGATAQTLQARLKGHIGDAERGNKTHRSNWIRSVLTDGLRPMIRTIDEGIPESELWRAEQREIAFARERGHRLTNGTEGGDGLLGHSMTPEDRARMRLAVRDGAKVARILDAIHPERVEARMERNRQRYRAASPARPIVDDLGNRYESISDAALALGEFTGANAIERCLKGKQERAFGRRYRWADEKS